MPPKRLRPSRASQSPEAQVPARWRMIVGARAHIENALSASSTVAPDRAPMSESTAQLASILASSTTKAGDGTFERSNEPRAPGSPARVAIIGWSMTSPSTLSPARDAARASEAERPVELLQLPWQALLGQHRHERVGVELLHVEDALARPLAREHQRGADHRGHAGRVADRLRADLAVARLVVADVVEIERPLGPALLAGRDVADAGLARGARAEIAGVRQHRLQELERHDLLALELDGLDRGHADVLQHPDMLG